VPAAASPVRRRGGGSRVVCAEEVPWVGSSVSAAAVGDAARGAGAAGGAGIRSRVALDGAAALVGAAVGEPADLAAETGFGALGVAAAGAGAVVHESADRLARRQGLVDATVG